jgi:hypothetical protein
MTERTTRAERLTLPLATSAIEFLAESNDGCIRPVQLCDDQRPPAMSASGL